MSMQKSSSHTSGQQGLPLKNVQPDWMAMLLKPHPHDWPYAMPVNVETKKSMILAIRKRFVTFNCIPLVKRCGWADRCYPVVSG